MSHVSVQSVTVLGATGSIGKSTLDVIAQASIGDPSFVISNL